MKKGKVMEMKIVVGKKTPCTKLPIGGKDQLGNSYEVNNKYMMKNGTPVLPIMGEFHFSRWMPEEWEEALLKMRAGGVEIVATYVFWIHHEEKKDEWDFTGCRDIRAFLQVCQKIQMPVWLRIGPWAHGECRNGGFPDWLVEELGNNGLFFTRDEESAHEARTNDELYMTYVKNFWSHLSEQTKGMMCKDGGPVLGIQLENEYCHAGGPRELSKGIAHMKTLKELAATFDFVVPYYTTTGWGGAVVLDRETLPVLGGYVDAPWAGHNHEMPACENFLFAPFREDENIGTDLKIEKEERVTFSKKENPYLTAELGGGLQVTALRRTYPFAEDIEAQAVCMLGAGANLLGYYMYHGGVNPDGKYSTLQESKETGYFNDLPIKSYDFQTCIRESGKLGKSYYKLKKLHFMIQCFEGILAASEAYFPEEAAESAEDTKTPRVCVRYEHETKTGFVFMNAHQRLRKMEPVEDLELTLTFPEEEIKLSHLSCESDSCAIIPFGLKMGNSRLLYTNLSLLGKLGERYFFYSHNEETLKPHFVFEDMPYENIVVLSKHEAEQAYLFGDKLYITEKAMYCQNDKLYVLTEEKTKITVYQETGDSEIQEIAPPTQLTSVSVTSKEAGKGIYELSLSYQQNTAHEIYLHMDFGGDRAALYEGDRLLTDWFSNGEEWVVALKRYHYPTKLTLKIEPFEEGIYYDLPPKKGCCLHTVNAEVLYKRELGCK